MAMTGRMTPDALTVAAALCGQPPEVTGPTLERLFAAFTSQPTTTLVTIDADLRSLEVGFRFPAMALSDVLAMVEHAIAGASEQAWSEVLRRAERVAAAEAIWVGLRFAGGAVTPMVRFESEWLMPAVVELLAVVGDPGDRMGTIAARFRGLDGHWQVAARGGADPRFALTRVVEFVAPTQTPAVSEVVASVVEDVVTPQGGERNPGALYAKYLRSELHHYRPGAGRKVITVTMSHARAGDGPSAVELEFPHFPSLPALQVMANLGWSLEGSDKLGTILGVLGLERDAQDNYWLHTFRMTLANERPPRFAFVIALS